MPGLAINDVVQVSFRGTLFGQKMLTILHYSVNVVGTGTVESQLQELANALTIDNAGVNLVTDYLAAIGPSFSLDTIRCQRVDPTRSVYQVSTANLNGTFATDCTTANIAASLLKRTATPGRRGLGRVQLPGVPAAAYTGGNLTNAYLTTELSNLCQDLMAGLTTPVSAVSMQPCIFNPGAAGSHFSPIVTVTPQETVRVMHRRTLFVGE